MWRRIGHFVGYKRIPISIGLGALFWVLASPTWPRILLGLPFIGLGEALRVWASGTLEKNVAVADRGPYALTRNPLYFGNFLIGLGFAVMGNSLWLLGLFLVLFPLIYLPTIWEEERFLRERFGESYEAYVRNVPRFFPLFSVRRWIPGQFRWALVIRHREHKTWYGLAAGIAAVVIRSWFLV